MFRFEIVLNLLEILRFRNGRVNFAGRSETVAIGSLALPTLQKHAYLRNSVHISVREGHLFGDIAIFVCDFGPILGEPSGLGLRGGE